MWWRSFQTTTPFCLVPVVRDDLVDRGLPEPVVLALLVASGGADPSGDFELRLDRQPRRLSRAQHRPRLRGAQRSWSTLSVDPDRDLVFIPTGSASPDHFGGLCKGDDKWANSVVALNPEPGVRPGFQVVHHDLRDCDVPSQSTLFTWRDGTPAIAVTTKMGRIFVLDHLTGAPLLPSRNSWSRRAMLQER